jgi:hypothetical protein
MGAGPRRVPASQPTRRRAEASWDKGDCVRRLKSSRYRVWRSRRAWRGPARPPRSATLVFEGRSGHRHRHGSAGQEGVGRRLKQLAATSQGALRGDASAPSRIVRPNASTTASKKQGSRQGRTVAVMGRAGIAECAPTRDKSSACLSGGGSSPTKAIASTPNS